MCRSSKSLLPPFPSEPLRRNDLLAGQRASATCATTAPAQRLHAHTDTIKRLLAQFIERTTSPADAMEVTAALLELGFERAAQPSRRKERPRSKRTDVPPRRAETPEA